MTLDFFHRQRAGFSLFMLIGICILFLMLRVDPIVQGLKTTLWFLISPEVVYTGQFFNKVDSLSFRLFNLVHAEGENVILRDQISVLSKKEIERDVLEDENNRLRNLLDLKKKYFPEGHVAEVVSHDIRDWFHTLTINKGYRDGIRTSAAVVSDLTVQPALVGRISDVEFSNSKVLLVTDLGSAVSVEIKGKGGMGLLEGRNTPTCLVRYLSKQSEITEGDEILTAGLGSVFPPGIPVGIVSSVEESKDGFFKEAKVLLHADIGSLREVLILRRLIWNSEDKNRE